MEYEHYGTLELRISARSTRSIAYAGYKSSYGSYGMSVPGPCVELHAAVEIECTIHLRSFAEPEIINEPAK